MSTNDRLQVQHRFQCKFQHKLSKNKNYPDFRFWWKDKLCCIPFTSEVWAGNDIIHKLSEF